MNKEPNIEELFEAARRQEADRKRQQKLSDMIDRMTAQETENGEFGAESGERRTESGEWKTERHRRLWVYSSVAASVLLLFTFGLHILFGDVAGPKDGPVLAEKQPVQPRVVSDTVSADSQAAAEVTPAYFAPKNNDVLVENAVPSQSVEQPAKIQTEPELLPTPQPEESLLAEAIHTVQPDTPQVAAAQHRVFERTSSRLVCGSGCTPERHLPSAGNAPQMAVVTLSGANTDFEVGSISF